MPESIPAAGASIPADTTTHAPPQPDDDHDERDGEAPLELDRIARLERRVAALEASLDDAHNLVHRALRAVEELRARVDAAPQPVGAPAQGEARELSYTTFRNPGPHTVRFEMHDYVGGLKQHVVKPGELAKVPTPYAHQIKALAPQLVKE